MVSAAQSVQREATSHDMGAAEAKGFFSDWPVFENLSACSELGWQYALPLPHRSSARAFRSDRPRARKVGNGQISLRPQTTLTETTW
jgi:hypothetical protein